MTGTYEELRTKIINAIESYLTDTKGTFFVQTALFSKPDAANFINYYLEKKGVPPNLHHSAKIDENRFAQITFLLTFIRCLDGFQNNKQPLESEHYTPEQIILLLAAATDFIVAEAYKTSTTQSAFYNALKPATEITSKMYLFNTAYELTAQLRHFLWKQIFVDPEHIMKGTLPQHLFLEVPTTYICSSLLLREANYNIAQTAQALKITANYLLIEEPFIPDTEDKSELEPPSIYTSS